MTGLARQTEICDSDFHWLPTPKGSGPGVNLYHLPQELSMFKIIRSVIITLAHVIVSAMLVKALR